MPTPSDIDRRLLGETSLVLDDDAYVQVVAGLGVSWFSWLSSAWGPQNVLRWAPKQLEIELRRLGNSPPAPALLNYRDEWTKALAASDNHRVMLVEAEFKERAPDLVAITRILDHPAAGAESLFALKEAPHLDLQWRWPLTIAAFQNDLERLELAKLLTTWPSQSLVQVQALTREQARCEILVLAGSVRDALRRVLDLRHTVRAGYLLLLCPLDISWNDVKSQVDLLLAETQAGGLSMVSPPTGWSAWQNINNLVRELSHNQPFDFALGPAFPRESSLHVLDLRLLDAVSLTNVARNLGRRLKRLPDDVALSLPAETPPRVSLGWTKAKPPSDLGAELEARVGELSFSHESEGGTALSEISVAEQEARSETSLSEVPRFLQGNIAALTEGGPAPEKRGFTAGTRYQFDVFIAPPGEGDITANVPVDETQIDWQERDSCTLQVLFVEPRQWDAPLQGKLELPRRGRSKNCRFIFTPTQAGAFAGRVIVYYRGRVLQTALLEAEVLAEGKSWGSAEPKKLGLVVESSVRRSLGTLDQRRRFDSWLLLNHTPSGKHVATSAGKDGAFIASLDGAEAQLANINALLTDVAYKQKVYAGGLLKDANAKLLCNLAEEGNVLYRNLVADYIDRSSAAQALRDSEYLQIVSARPDAIVPLEFVYSYPPPREGAPVCKNAKEALRSGRCPGSCRPEESPAEHVCPLGFWGLSKVIERHVHDPELPKAARVEGDTGDPVRGRDVLTLKGVSLIAASKQVPAASWGELETAIRSAWSGDVAAVRKWSDWKPTVQTKKPVLFVVLPHADGKDASLSLEISGDVMKSIQIDDTYVCSNQKQPPIVLLLGCDVTNTATPGAYARQIGIFRQAKAALVLGTVATVLGADGAKVAGRLVTRLSDTAKKSTERFGDVLRQVKREAVADSLMVAMCLVAFGDADWYLK